MVQRVTRQFTRGQFAQENEQLKLKKPNLTQLYQPNVRYPNLTYPNHQGTNFGELSGHGYKEAQVFQRHYASER